MDSVALFLGIALVLLVLGVIGFVGFRRGGSGNVLEEKPRPGIDYAPGVGDDDSVPRDTPRRSIDVIDVGEPLAVPAEDVVEEAPAEAPSAEDLEALLVVEVPDPAAGRLQRLRARLARSQNAVGRGLLALLSSGSIDEDTWDQVEETLLTADLGVAPTQELL
jgi:fused signal recognition particle receptor